MVEPHIGSLTNARADTTTAPGRHERSADKGVAPRRPRMVRRAGGVVSIKRRRSCGYEINKLALKWWE